MRHHFVKRVSPATDHDDNDRHACGGRLGDEGELLGREPEVGGIAELAGGVRTGQAAPASDEDDRYVGLLHLVDDLDPLPECLQRGRRRVLRGELRLNSLPTGDSAASSCCSSRCAGKW